MAEGGALLLYQYLKYSRKSRMHYWRMEQAVWLGTDPHATPKAKIIGDVSAKDGRSRQRLRVS